MRSNPQYSTDVPNELDSQVAAQSGCLDLAQRSAHFLRYAHGPPHLTDPDGDDARPGRYLALPSFLKRLADGLMSQRHARVLESLDLGADRQAVTEQDLAKVVDLYPHHEVASRGHGRTARAPLGQVDESPPGCEGQAEHYRGVERQS